MREPKPWRSRSRPVRQRPEFVAKAVQEWIAAVGAKTGYIAKTGGH
jgi:hypothetical protein